MYMEKQERVGGDSHAALESGNMCSLCSNIQACV